MTRHTHSTVAAFCFSTMALAALVTLSMSSLTFAEGGAKGKAGADRGAKKNAGAAGKQGQGKQGQARQGQGRQGQAKQRQGRQGQAGGGRGERDPAQMAQRMIEHHDKNGDGALNARELAVALTAMRERRQEGGRPEAGGGKGRADGGKRPKRPE